MTAIDRADARAATPHTAFRAPGARSYPTPESDSNREHAVQAEPSVAPAHGTTDPQRKSAFEAKVRTVLAHLSAATQTAADGPVLQTPGADSLKRDKRDTASSLSQDRASGPCDSEVIEMGAMRVLGRWLAQEALDGSPRGGVPFTELDRLGKAIANPAPEFTCALAAVARGIAQELGGYGARVDEPLNAHEERVLVAWALEVAVFGKFAPSALSLADGALCEAAQARLTLRATRELVEARVRERLGKRADLAPWITRLLLDSVQPLLLEDALASVVFGSEQWVVYQTGVEMGRAAMPGQSRVSGHDWTKLVRLADLLERPSQVSADVIKVSPYTVVLQALHDGKPEALEIVEGSKAWSTVPRSVVQQALTALETRFDARWKAELEAVRALIIDVGQLVRTLKARPPSREQLAQSLIETALEKAGKNPAKVDVASIAYAYRTQVGSAGSLTLSLPDLDRTYEASWLAYRWKVKDALQTVIQKRLDMRGARDWLARAGEHSGDEFAVGTPVAKHYVFDSHDGAFRERSLKPHDHPARAELIVMGIDEGGRWQYAVLEFERVLADLLTLGRTRAEVVYGDDIAHVLDDAQAQLFNAGEFDDYGKSMFSNERMAVVMRPWVASKTDRRWDAPLARTLASTLAEYMAQVVAETGQREGYGKTTAQTANEKIAYGLDNLLEIVVPFYGTYKAFSRGDEVLGTVSALSDVALVMPLVGSLGKALIGFSTRARAAQNCAAWSYTRLGDVSRAETVAARAPRIELEPRTSLPIAPHRALTQDTALSIALKRYQSPLQLDDAQRMAGVDGVVEIEGKHYVRIDGHDYFMERTEGRWSIGLEDAPWKPRLPVRLDATSGQWALDEARGLIGGDKAIAESRVRLLDEVHQWGLEHAIPHRVVSRIKAVVAAGTGVLDLSDIALREVPAFIKRCESITTLILRPGAVDAFSIGGDALRGINTLRLVGGQARTVTSKMLEGMVVEDLNGALPSLASLEIERTDALERIELARYPVGALRVHSASALSSVEVVDCVIDHVELGALPELEELHVIQNGLDDGELVIESAPKLRYIDLSGNRFTDAPDALAHCPSLQAVTIARNRLTALHGLESHTALKFVDASENALRRVPLLSNSLGSLETLRLRANALTGSADVIPEYPSLRHLDLGENALGSIPESIGRCEALQKLWVDHNQLRQGGFPESMSKLRQLTKLYAGHNPIDSVPDVIGRLGSLRELHLENTGLVELPDHMAELPLDVLDLADNPLGRVPKALLREAGFFSLQHLDLSRTGLRGVPTGLGHRRNLLTLTLDANVELSDLPADLSMLDKLVVLSLRDCAFRELPDVIPKMANLVKIAPFDVDLRLNPLGPSALAAIQALARSHAESGGGAFWIKADGIA